MCNEIKTASSIRRLRTRMQWLRVAPLIAALALGGCSNALIYGESTNFSLASLKLNDSVAEPISVNSGLERTVAALAPAGEKDDAVNMVAGFALDHSGAPLALVPYVLTDKHVGPYRR